MKLVVVDRYGSAITGMDITGQLWVSAHDGITNRDVIAMPVTTIGGTPAALHCYDLLGTLISVCTIDCNPGFVEKGTVVRFMPGEITIHFMILNKTKQ